MKKLILGLIVLLLLIIACVQTNVVRLGPQVARPLVPPDQVMIYRTADQVPGKYEEIALITAKGSSGWTNEEMMFRKMRERAGKLGANGVILEALSEPSAGAKIAGAFLGLPAERQGKVIAIFVFEKE